MYPRALYLWIVGIAVTLGFGACSGAGSPLSQSLPFAHHRGGGSSPIAHVVILVQENRSFDDFFATFPGANGATFGMAKIPQGTGYVEKKIPLKPHSLTLGFDLGHCHAAFINDYDGGAMDGFFTEQKDVCGKRSPWAKKYPYEYVKPALIAPYWDIADQWVLADNMFQTQGSGSFTAHQDLIRGGTCINGCSKPSSSTESLIDSPTYWPWGCDAGKTVQTYTINIYGKVQLNGPRPCSNLFADYSTYDTIATLLDSAGISWKYYTPCFNSKAQPGCTPSNDCNGGASVCDADLLNAFDVIYPVRYGSEWGTNVSWPETNILSDVSGGALPAVSWVIPEDNASDHPGQKVDNGPSWVADVVNAIGGSQYWNSTVIIVLWDDWGGFYDHVAPKQFGYGDVNAGLGFRVPMLILSPYAIAGGGGGKGGNVSHTQYEFGSILKFIEQNWNLPSLVDSTDARANSIGDVLNYLQSPRPFATIPSRQDAQYFIKRSHLVQGGDPE